MRKVLSVLCVVFLSLLMVSQVYGATLKEIQDRGVIKVALDVTEPFCYEEEGQLKGLEVDMANAIAEAIGVKLEISLPGWENITKAWDPNYDWSDFDIAMGAITITEERAKVCDFSDWYFMSGQMVIVPKDSSIQSPDQLKGRKVAALKASVCEDVASQLTDQIVLVSSVDEGYEKLLNGEADAMVYDGGFLQYKVKKDPRFRLLDENFTRERYGVAMPKNTSELKAVIDEVVKKNRKELFEKWFK
ncbi:amino acid ABC transporter substrate-binding protein, PAAT family [Thermovirga lienii DSM 17291]|uniref:Amino acid ABC transporter substrate-binding protein, PAAT family n=1 Tax=Thermovirga lienii (strain ATCC BAA-1197 / DSM 17291 / Cas60314) TaxID=580340 RepID=G7V923_THELD|nr:transporter substrate-binding domain-containing protein [Thermovirga lienii]AER67557.1 amino acid ABC transporter substrate-binding protein, PAAT family [Thermovirga lienii DSM 17291]